VRFCRQVSPQPPRAQRSFRISRLVVAMPVPFFLSSCLSADYMADRELESVVSTGESHAECRTCQVFCLIDYPTVFLSFHLRASDVAGANMVPYFGHWLSVPFIGLLLN
jgi:hypothetical protein